MNVSMIIGDKSKDVNRELNNRIFCDNIISYNIMIGNYEERRLFWSFGFHYNHANVFLLKKKNPPSPWGYRGFYSSFSFYIVYICRVNSHPQSE